MITKFKLFEEGIFKYTIIDPQGRAYSNLEKMLCIDNHIGELEDTYDFTIGKIYNVKRHKTYFIKIVDDKGVEKFFNSETLFKNFSTDESYDDYLLRKNVEKYNL